MSRPVAPANYCGRTRREFLHQLGGGFGSVALTSMLSGDGFAFDDRGNAEAPQSLAAGLHHQPKAKNVIFLFMYGGPSHMDTFDYKPEMEGRDGQTVEVKTFGRGGKKNEGRIVEPRWKFKPYGECGKMVSDLFPHVGECVDDIAFLHSMTAESPIHGSAMLMMNSGQLLSGAPAMGSWVNYGLGTENENLPGYVVMLDPSGGPISGAKNWSSGYMPSKLQGTTFRTAAGSQPIYNLKSDRLTPEVQRAVIDAINDRNRDHLGGEGLPGGRGPNSDLNARIASYELAYNMQTAAPEAVDLSQETAETHKLYGTDDAKTEDFGRRCLVARRLVERGVRFVQLYAGGHHNDNNWDAHGDLEVNHNLHAGRTDKPVAALLKDLKRRGMLDETLVIWGGEFGRQPTAEYAKGSGRDHNSYGFTMWMAGGGIKGGVSVGSTDELGARAVDQPMHVRRLHATVLHQLGLDPNRLTYFHAGLDRKLTGVGETEPIAEIV
ncbi:DUF1501 domain-containing protein [Alienimonas chondri]|uniref:DUF1501 domain-containing protein n=1 Tax=Alienimonas chondri TaxID=2681879 RepID=A0ABX1VH96_9PLAN|nr:DUF1501 domain-containing protein [Alienimonas chondri]NNJ26841.1 hypothetical protein [Alienimonas chondri]